MRSLSSLCGISVEVSSPLIIPGSQHDIYPALATRIVSYQQTVTRDAGYNDASFSISGQLGDLEEWIDNGLGRHIEVYTHELRKMFEGFANRLIISVGAFSQEVGPLVDVANQIVVLYQPIDPTSDPPATGPEAETTAATNDDSQDLYGVWEVVFNGGQANSLALAEQYRDVLLGDVAWPKTTERLNLPPQMQVTLTVECLGYWAFAKAYIYNDATAGTRTVTAKLQDILGDDPNGIFSTDYSYMDTNAVLIAARARDNRVAWEVIRELVAGGDGTNFYRWNFGFYDNRVVYHSAIPTKPLYWHKLSSGDARVTYQNDTQVYYHDILPGEWLFVTDYLVGRVQPGTDIVRDPRMLLIESVRWSMPNNVEINGSTLDKLPQLLAQQGLMRGIT
jgi:hypothetical protein